MGENLNPIIRNAISPFIDTKAQLESFDKEEADRIDLLTANKYLRAGLEKISKQNEILTAGYADKFLEVVRLKEQIEKSEAHAKSVISALEEQVDQLNNTIFQLHLEENKA